MITALFIDDSIRSILKVLQPQSKAIFIEILGYHLLIYFII